jgi:hypothetical protein
MEAMDAGDGSGCFGMVHFGMLFGFCETPRKEPAGRDWLFPWRGIRGWRSWKQEKDLAV